MVEEKVKERKISSKGDDLFSCGRCGNCLAVCPVYKETLDEGNAPRGKLSLIEALHKQGLQPSEKFTEKIYTCTQCNYCKNECPSGVKVDELFKTVREDLVEETRHPEVLQMLKERIEKSYNVTFDTNEGRLEWIKKVPDIDVADHLNKQAEVIYFVGCVSSFSPRASSIPRAIVTLFKEAGVDFGLLGEDEWCCGFPLLSSGMKKEAIGFADYNIEKISSLSPKKLITSCPSCYHTFKHEYPELTSKKIDFEVMHISQYLLELIKKGDLSPGPLELKVAYHDPCDLGRNSGIFEEPREVIKKIPSVELVELASNKMQANCCGGGGNLESINPGLAASIAAKRASEIIESGARVLVSSCQQCERTLSTALKKKKKEIDYKIKVMDLPELVLKSLDNK